MPVRQLLDETTNVSFIFCIAATKQGAPDNYCVERMRSFLLHDGKTQVDTDGASFLRMIAPVPSAPLADTASHPVVSGAVERQHQMRIACALRSVDTETPLLNGEVIERDTFTFLTKPFNGCPERTAVLQRTTNYGVLLYLFDRVTVDPDGRLMLEAHSPDFQHARYPELRTDASSIAMSALPELQLFAKPLGESLATSFAKGLATKLLSSVGGVIASSIAGGILDALFPPGVPSYFDEVYAQIEKIVDAGLQQSTIELVNGAINSIDSHLVTEYGPARLGKDLKRLEDRVFLFTLLQKYESTYLTGPGGMLGTLMQDRYAKPGLGVFLFGASLHLALYQEMANVDPSNRDGSGEFRSPLESSYGLPGTGTVAATASKYAEFVDKVWPLLVKDRSAKIQLKKKRVATQTSTLGAAFESYGWFRDDLSPGSKLLRGR